MALQPNGLLTRLVMGRRLPIRQEAQVGEHRRVKTLLAALGTIAALAMMALLVLGLSLLLGGRRAQPAMGVPSPTVGVQAEGATPFGQGVAELLANPPAAGETVEVDAYFSGATPTYLPGPPRVLGDQVYCPTYSTWMAALTDRPFTPLLRVLNGTSSNRLPAGGAWLAATTPEATQPGQMIVPDLPYQAHFRGHLGDPAFAACPDAGRIFVVEEVTAVYQQEPPGGDEGVSPLQPPADYADWPRHDDTALGYSLPYPPGWTVYPMLDEGSVAAVALRSPQWPDCPVQVRVYEGETWYDQYEPASIPPLLQGDAFGLFTQGWVWDSQMDTQGLSGFTVERACQQDGAACRTVKALFSGNGHTYELSLTYPLGFDASQALLIAYTAIVEGLWLDPQPGPTPPPPIKQELGPGPFIDQEAALVAVREGQNIELLGAQLVPEAEARRQSGACSTFEGHPDGVWLLQVRGTFEDSERTMLFFVDAESGVQLCGEER
jgi:hypothetical protein